MSSTEVPAVACSAVSGSHVCSGTSGALTAKATMKDTKIQRIVVCGAARLPTRDSTRNSSPWCGP